MDLLGNTDAALRRFWHPVAAVDDVGPSLHPVSLLGDRYVLWRDRSGRALALRDRCPHRFGRLSSGCVEDDGSVRCGYHGWRFAADGRCVGIPALGPGAALPPAATVAVPAVREQHGLVFLAPEQPAVDPLEVPEWDDASLGVTWLPATTIRAPAGVFIDNFCDFGHFPFVHAGTFGAGEDALVGELEVERFSDGYRLVYEHLANNTEDPAVATGEHPLLQPRRMEYTYRVPFSARLRIEYPMSGLVNAIATWCQPVDDTTTVVHTAMVRNDLADEAAAREAVAYELAIFAEDVAMLEQLDVHGLPLDVRDQVHTRADRPTVELRRLLAAHTRISP